MTIATIVAMSTVRALLAIASCVATYARLISLLKHVCMPSPSVSRLQVLL